MTSTLPCLSSSIITGSSRWTRSWYDCKKREPFKIVRSETNKNQRTCTTIESEKWHTLKNCNKVIRSWRAVPLLLGICSGIYPDPLKPTLLGMCSGSFRRSSLHIHPVSEQYTLMNADIIHINDMQSPKGSRHTNSIYLIEDFPLFIRNSQLFSRLDGSP